MNPCAAQIVRGIGRIAVMLMLTLATTTACSTVSCDWANISPDKAVPGADAKPDDDG
jgi:hypothetical protein